MTSELKCGQYLEWCTKLPVACRPVESPVFRLRDNEWFFRITDYEHAAPPYYQFYLYLKNKHSYFRPCNVLYEVGFKNEKVLSLNKEEFVLRAENFFWGIYWHDIQGKLPRDYEAGNWIKLRFFFDDTEECLLKNSDETEKQAECGIYDLLKTRMSPDSGQNIHLEALSRDFSKLLDENSSCDVKIACEGKTFNAHRIILQMRSAVFFAMLNSKMLEDETGLIRMEDFNASVFECFLRYLYSGRLSELTVDVAKELYETADKYAVEELKKGCSEFLIKNLSEDIACEVLVLADQHSDQEFRKKVISYIIDKKVPEIDSCWLDFSESHSNLAVEVLNLYIRKNRSKIYLPKVRFPILE